MDLMMKMMNFSGFGDEYDEFSGFYNEGDEMEDEC